MTASIEAAIEAVQKEQCVYTLDINTDLRFTCPMSVRDKSVRRGDNDWQAREVCFSSAPDYAFFTGLREILQKRYDQEGRFLANLLALKFDPNRFSNHNEYDSKCADLFKDIVMVSVADPANKNNTIYDTNVCGLAERWGVNYTNLALYDGKNIDISADSPNFIRMNDPKNNLQADFVWACNVVSYPAVRGVDLDAMEKQAQVYQTFAALTEMVKPATGQLLLVSTLDKNVHYSIEADVGFHRMLGLERSNAGYGSRYSLFTRNSETKITELQITRHIAESEKKIDGWSRLG